MRLNPYLMFNGQCETAFKFYEKCLLRKILRNDEIRGYANGRTNAS